MKANSKFCTECGTPVVKAAEQPPKCTKCGAELKVNSKFCTECGTPIDAPKPVAEPVETQAPPEQPQPVVEPVETQAPAQLTVQIPKCTKCGAELKAGSKFCTACGTPVDAPNTVVESTETQTTSAQVIQHAAKQTAKTAVSQVGSAAKQTAKTAVSQAGSVAKQTAKTAVSQAGSAAVHAVQKPLSDITGQIASSQPGEAVLGTFGNISGATASISEILNPFKTLLVGVKSLGQNFVGLFKNKQWVKLIIAGIIAVVWIVLMILRRYGINVRVLNWLTFAQGDAGQSVSGWLGGLLGKATVATMIFSLIGGGYKSLGNGFKSLFSGKNFKTNNLGVLLLGAGGALIVYQFFAGNASLTDTMPAISGALLSVTALGRGNGFLYRFVQSLTAKKAGALRVADNEKISGLLSGMTYGFALGAAVSAIPFGRLPVTLGTLVSFIPFGWLPVILGGVCLTVGIVLTIVFGNKKEVASA